MDSFSKFPKKPNAAVRVVDLSKLPPEGRVKAFIGVLEDGEPVERREHPRKRYFTTIDYAAGERSYRDFVRDVALGGLFIETHETFEVGQEMFLVLPLLNTQKPLKISCRVVRATPEGVGVTFSLETSEQRLIIENLVEQIED